MFQLQVLFYKFLMLINRFLIAVLPENKPTLFSGAGSSLQLTQAMAQLGAKKVLLVTDKILNELGLIKPIADSLEQEGVNVVIFDGVEPDPSFGVVEAGLEMLKQNDCDSVLAVGGGSSIDAAKVMALAANNDKTPKQLEGKLKARNQAIPLFAIPTTAGTGSEVTVAAVITDKEEDQKRVVIDPKLVPIAAALDPELMKGMPAPITAATGMDALTHAVEAYISKFAAPKTDAYAVAAIRLIIKNLTASYDDGSNLKAREGMAKASFYAGLAFTKAFVGYVHAIAHQFGAKYHTPHGLANAIALPHILEFSKPAVAHRLAQLAIECELGDRSESDWVLAGKFIDKVWEISEHMGVPKSLDALKSEDIPLITKGALAEAHYTFPVPRYMDRQQCEAILMKMLPS
ncbi:MAG: iron-containing alcohol dehydrogenase [Candidatus Pelagadaptatus aseana]|uniref:iron-containing alcohol dehydrogenase n=1 Tax=Candidatus Pelagadaptatus aseana TaxID=3120508 RepID=UPI0039B329F7